VLDLRAHHDVVRLIDEMLRHFEAGGPPPAGARQLLTQLSNGLAEGGPAETGLSPRRLRAARKAASRGVEGLEDEVPAVQGREAERALRRLAELFGGPAPSRGSRLLAVVLTVVAVGGIATAIAGHRPRWVATCLLIGIALVAYGIWHEPEAGAREGWDVEGRHIPVGVGWVAGGLALLAIAASGLWFYSPPAPTPRDGRFSGSGNSPGFAIEFVASGGAIATHVTWRASCQSGRVWADESHGGYDNAGAWNETGFNYTTSNTAGYYVSGAGPDEITEEHIHVSLDKARFTTPTTAEGVFNQSVVLDDGTGRPDTCHTGAVRWTAQWVSAGGSIG
jgi:hypothetical protein